jgi:hypothetical protein
MQATKDTFYITLRDRLASVYPGRTMVVDGSTRTAIVAEENDKPSIAKRQLDTFYLSWGEVRTVCPAISRLLAMSCVISFESAGTEVNGGVDRGRSVGEMEAELTAVCAPATARKCDYTGGAPMDLASSIFWSSPAFRGVKSEPDIVGVESLVTVYFYPEVNQA